MNLEQEMQEQGWDTQTDVSGTELQVQSSGAKFTAIIDPAPPIDPGVALDSDIREKSILSVKSEDDPGLVYGDVLVPTAATEESTSDEPATSEPDFDDIPFSYRVTEREANPGDFVNKYWIVKVTEKDS